MFTDVVLTQPKDSQNNPTTEQDEDSNGTKTLLYVGVAAVIIVGAIVLLFKNPTDKNKKTESENKNFKDSTTVNKTDTTQIKR
ncbi:MAG: hypothetical protein WC358_06465 [Ignavibacteria bacterium]